MKILAIETSCDETAIAMADFSGGRKNPTIGVNASLISSQVKLHEKFGGVVPNLARREHEKNLVPILLRALKEAGLKEAKSKKQELRTIKILDSILEREPELLAQFKKQIAPLTPPAIDAIAVTSGPGLAPALWVGVNFARALAYLWKKPLIPVNHMAGHFYSAFLQKKRGAFNIQHSTFPVLALLVSGGHTELILARGHGKFNIIGETVDDAAGEAFDKVARMLGLPYPGGPAISALAKIKFKVKSLKLKVSLPRPMLNSKDHNFSFSGLKTAVLYLTRDLGVKKTKRLRPLIAREFQDAVIGVLIKKTVRAAKEYNAKAVLLGGGVAANKKLRKDLTHAIVREIPGAQCLVPSASLTGDNALMIAMAAYFCGTKKAWYKVHADANARLGK